MRLKHTDCVVARDNLCFRWACVIFSRLSISSANYGVTQENGLYRVCKQSTFAHSPQDLACPPNESALRKHAYSNILKILPPKFESFQIKILIFFIFLLKT